MSDAVDAFKSLVGGRDATKDNPKKGGVRKGRDHERKRARVQDRMRTHPFLVRFSEPDRTIRSRGGRTELTLETNGTRCRQARRDETCRTGEARSAQGSPGAREAGAEGKGERGAPRGQDETDPARTREAPRKGGQGTPRERGAQAARPAGLSPALSDGRRTCYVGTKLQKRRPGPVQERA